MAIDLYNLVLTAKIQKGGGGGDIEVDALTATENGTYSASSGHAYDPVTVSVPTGVFPSGTSSITANGIYDVTNFASASVNVPGIVPSGTSSITSNGIYDITNFASVDVNVSGGGGITADDIAERTISGVMSGSASFIASFAFKDCSSITGAIFPSATVVSSSAFHNCNNLQTISFPLLERIESNGFAYCSSLTTAYIPNVVSINASAFNGCGFSSIDLEKATFLNAPFQQCSKLSTAVLRNVKTMSGWVFASCKSLMAVYVLASSLATLSTSSAFRDTPMASTSYTGAFGSIYVPASLVETYKSAANWSTYSARITSYVE